MENTLDVNGCAKELCKLGLHRTYNVVHQKYGGEDELQLMCTSPTTHVLVMKQ